jgi:hypothetical protein
MLIPVKNMACPIPVFRYALEFWETDLYRLEIFYKDTLDSGDKELINYLLSASQGNGMKSNLKMRTVNIRDKNQNIPQYILEDFRSEDFPLIVLRYPVSSGISSVLWSAPFNRKNIDLLLNSPARDSIANKLITDVTAVWVFLESGDRHKDNETLALLNKELRRLEQTLVLPDLELWVNNYKGESGEKVPKIKFEVLRVSRDDPREELFIKMLMGTEKYLTKFQMEPMVFPVYGRGLVLLSLVGQGIDEKNVGDAADFLTGPCSCQAKLLNPGVDLLISMDWNKLVYYLADVNIANPLTGLGDFSTREAEVKRQLEAAVYKRLGTAGNTDTEQDNGPGKLVYLGTLGSTTMKDQNDKEKVTGKVDETGITWETKESPDEKPAYRETANASIERSIVIIDQVKQKKNFKNNIVMFFAVVFGIVIFGVIVLFLKKISKK